MLNMTLIKKGARSGESIKVRCFDRRMARAAHEITAHLIGVEIDDIRSRWVHGCSLDGFVTVVVRCAETQGRFLQNVGFYATRGVASASRATQV